MRIVWQRLIQIIGVLTSALSLWGFRLLADVFRRELVRPLHPPETAPFFRQAFFTMNAINAVFLTSMILTAVGLVLLKPSATKVYTWLWVTIVVYMFAGGILWAISGPIGASIAAATGVGNAGLELLLFYPFPFVYLILSVGVVNLAARQLGTTIARSGTSRAPVPQ